MNVCVLVFVVVVVLYYSSIHSCAHSNVIVRYVDLNKIHTKTHTRQLYLASETLIFNKNNNNNNYDPSPCPHNYESGDQNREKEKEGEEEKNIQLSTRIRLTKKKIILKTNPLNMFHYLCVCVKNTNVEIENL